MKNITNEINFNKILFLENTGSIDQYDFNKHLELKEHQIKGFCTLCEEKKFNGCPEDPDFKLKNISHGATSNDFLQATDKTNIDFSKWHNEGVLFLMEGPSKDYGIYKTTTFNGIEKRPSKEWYWVHEKQNAFLFPQEFKGGTYGTLINSIIFTFKLKNAYLTNLVKCGLNDKDDNYKGIDNYDKNCLQTCFDHILKKEIDLIQPKIIFTFGTKVFNWFQTLNPDYKGFIASLPHPVGHRRGFKDEFYRHLYFHLILEGLYIAKIIDLDEAKGLFQYFLET